MATPYNVAFNGYSLQNSSFRTRIIQHTNIPTKNIQAEPRARDSGMTIVNVKYSSRTIDVEGMLTAATRQALVDAIDAMKLNLRGQSGTLDIDYGNNTRRYYATVQDIEIPEDFYNISQVPYKITFFCADPFGYTTSSGTVTASGISSMLQDTIITVSGNVDGEPAVMLFLSVANNLSLITVSNQDSSETIVISKPGGNFSAGDAIVINSHLKTVQINNSGIDYTGRFPSLSLPTTRLRVALTATAATWSYIVNYPPRYL